MPSTRLQILLIAFTAFPTASNAAEPQKPLIGSDITYPERISGIWEAQGTQPTYALDIELTTKVFGLPTTLASIPQKVIGIVFGIYEVRSVVSSAGRHFFTGDSDGVQLTARTIKVSHSKVDGSQAVELDLTFDPRRDRWSGTVHTDHFNGQTTFLRPHPKPGIAKSPLAGTWKHYSPVGICLHVAQQSDASLAGWSDQLQIPGLIRYANGIRPPSETIERYGVQAQLDLVSPDAILIDRNPYAAGGNRQIEVGERTSDPNIMSAGAFEPWRRVAGDSCAASSPASKENTK